MTAASILRKAIRLIACAGMAAAFIALFMVSLHEGQSFGSKFLGIVCLAVAILFMMLVLRTFSPNREMVLDPTMEELEQQGILISEEHDALQAIEIEELEDEGPGYLLELDDGSVLCLQGQYLDDYGPGFDADGQLRLRRFPNTHFKVKIHQKSGQIWDIACLGDPFEPILTVPPLTAEEHEASQNPEDGEIITGLTFEELIESKGRLPKPSRHV